MEVVKKYGNFFVQIFYTVILVIKQMFLSKKLFYFSTGFTYNQYLCIKSVR